MDTSKLPLDFFPFYMSGSKIRVEFPDGQIKQGKVGVSQEPVPRFWLINGCRVVREITPGSRYVGPAIRKERIDNRAYLNGKIPTFREEGRNTIYTCRVCGHVPSMGDIIPVRPKDRQFKCPACGVWQNMR
jgi:predicted RNA-binding Zn-ribbon protein involved in translation (DUF1610 family)